MHEDKEKKKILFVLTKDDVGGAQKYVTDLAKGLDPNRFIVTMLHGGRQLNWLSNKVSPWFLFLNDWIALFELVRIFRREQPDIIHLNSSKAGVLGSLASRIYKIFLRFQLPITNYQLPNVVFTAHGWVFNPSNALSPFMRFSYILFHRIAGLFQDTIICVSEYDRTLALELRVAPARKLITIHNGIDYQNLKFLDKVSSRQKIIRKLPITNYQLLITKPWIGSIGRLVKEKDYQTFIQAAREVPDALFFIIGEGPQYEKLQLLISHEQLQKRFFIVPPTGNDSQFLKAFDIFVMSSVKEGFPYVLLEAMAAGVPIISTDVGGIPEAIKNNETGILVSPRDPKVLGNAIRETLDQPETANALGENAKRLATNELTLTNMIRKTEECYESLVNR